jgi:hypothetical protein
MIDYCGAVGGITIGKGNRSTQRKPASVPLCPPQIPHDLTWVRTRAAAVGRRRATNPTQLWHSHDILKCNRLSRQGQWVRLAVRTAVLMNHVTHQEVSQSALHIHLRRLLLKGRTDVVVCCVYFRNEIVLYLSKHRESSLCALCRRGLKFWFVFKNRTSEFLAELVLIKSVTDGSVSAISEVKSQRRIQCSGGPISNACVVHSEEHFHFFLVRVTAIKLSYSHFCTSFPLTIVI